MGYTTRYTFPLDIANREYDIKIIFFGNLSPIIFFSLTKKFMFFWRKFGFCIETCTMRTRLLVTRLMKRRVYSKSPKKKKPRNRRVQWRRKNCFKMPRVRFHGYCKFILIISNTQYMKNTFCLRSGEMFS